MVGEGDSPERRNYEAGMYSLAADGIGASSRCRLADELDPARMHLPVKSRSVILTFVISIWRLPVFCGRPARVGVAAEPGRVPYCFTIAAIWRICAMRCSVSVTLKRAG